MQVGELTPEELFAKFRSIVDMYILAGSELEVNIETAMRNKVLKVSSLREGIMVSLPHAFSGGCYPYPYP